MVEIIALIAFAVGGAGAGIILARKMPQAIAGAQNYENRRLGWRAGIVFILGKVKHHPRVEGFSWMEFLQKQLLKARVAVLKVDNKINDLAAKLRQKREKKTQEDKIAAENYWRDLKGIVKNRKFLAKTKQNNSAPQDSMTTDAVVVSESRKSPENALAVKKTALPESQSEKPIKISKKRGAKKRKAKSEDPFSW